MINPVNQLNDIIRNFSITNANASLSQLAAIIDSCSKAWITFSYDENYQESLASFLGNKFPEWNIAVINKEIESIANNGKYDEAVAKRDELLLLKNELNKKFRIEKYGTEDWFIEQSASEIFFLPTNMTVIDSLIFEL